MDNNLTVWIPNAKLKRSAWIPVPCGAAEAASCPWAQVSFAVWSARHELVNVSQIDSVIFDSGIVILEKEE